MSASNNVRRVLTERKITRQTLPKTYEKSPFVFSSSTQLKKINEELKIAKEEFKSCVHDYETIVASYQILFSEFNDLKKIEIEYVNEIQELKLQLLHRDDVVANMHGKIGWLESKIERMHASIDDEKENDVWRCYE